MSKITKGKLPVNARIDIDYTKSKPKVKFTYPKKDAVKQNLVGVHTLIIMLIGAIILYSPFFMWEESEPIKNCSTFINETNWEINSSINGKGLYLNGSYVNNIKIDCNNRTITIKQRTSWNRYNGEHEFYVKEQTETDYLLPVIIFSLGVLISMFLLNWIVTKILIRCKWYQKWLPVHNAKGKKKYIKFLPKDIEYNVAIIPYFSNVCMNYNAEGEFSKYLAKVSVRELQYFETDKKGKVKGKKKKDIFKWSAVFYFKQKPKNGFLEVIYK